MTSEMQVSLTIERFWAVFFAYGHTCIRNFLHPVLSHMQQTSNIHVWAVTIVYVIHHKCIQIIMPQRPTNCSRVILEADDP